MSQIFSYHNKYNKVPKTLRYCKIITNTYDIISHKDLPMMQFIYFHKTDENILDLRNRKTKKTRFQITQLKIATIYFLKGL
jgi:hypothetical protein